MLFINKKKKIEQNNSIEPWNIDFLTRLRIITTKTSRKKVIYIFEAANTSTFRYRVYNMWQALNYSKSWIGSFFFENELSTVNDFIDQSCVIIFGRTRWSLIMANFLEKAKAKKITTVFDSDDLVFNIDMIPQLMNTLNVSFENYDNYDYWFAYISRLWQFGKMCDATIGTNEFLCNKLRETFDKPSFVINNFLNNEQIEVSNKLYNDKKTKCSNEELKLGYFSGTPSHTNDFRKIEVEIIDLLRNYPRITLEIVGFMEFSNLSLDLIKEKRIFYTQLVDFLALQKKIAEVDINIVPLIENDFTNCKSELKFFEASIVGTITCATPIYSYRNSIQNNKTGFLCKEGEWYSTIEQICKKRIDNKIISRARSYCLNRYSPKNQVHNIERVLDAIALE